MKRYLLVLLCLFLLFPIDAQIRKKVQTVTIHEPVAISQEINDLIKKYEFEKAGKLVQTQITLSKRKKLPIDSLNDKARQIRIGENMLLATAKITFVDSFVVNKKDILKVLKLDASNGELFPWSNFFEDKKASSEIQNSLVYINDFKDKMFYCYPDSDGFSKLYCRYKLDEKWAEPTLQKGLGDSTSEEAYPFLLSDGVTLYFASKSDKGLGGYDIYVTRYNTDTKQYLKPENMGMPFNSPSNDYMMAIDEVNNLGWFVSDRYQNAGKVCVYQFIPEETRNVYPYSTANADSVRKLAMIHDISSSQGDKVAVIAARERFKLFLERASVQKNKVSNFDFVVYNGIIYHSLDDFKSNKAKQLATNWEDLISKRTSLLTELKKYRENYKGNKSLDNIILKEEQAVTQLDDVIVDLEWNIRFEEQSKLGINK